MYKLKYNKDGLVPVIIQDYRTGKVLMMAYMNKLAFSKTLKTKRTCFYSRSRKKLWVKGEQSGNYQIVKEVYLDCDSDTVLIKVKQIGNASCHRGYETCFYGKIDKDKIKITGKKIFDPAKVYV